MSDRRRQENAGVRPISRKRATTAALRLFQASLAFATSVDWALAEPVKQRSPCASVQIQVLQTVDGPNEVADALKPLLSEAIAARFPKRVGVLATGGVGRPRYPDEMVINVAVSNVAGVRGDIVVAALPSVFAGPPPSIILEPAIVRADNPASAAQAIVQSFDATLMKQIGEPLCAP